MPFESVARRLIGRIFLHSLCLFSLLLISLTFLSIPLFADDTVSLPVTAADGLKDNLAATSFPVESSAAVTGEQSVQTELDTASKDMFSQGAGSIFQLKHARFTKTSLGLIAAGLLLVPFDNRVVDHLPRTGRGMHGDSVTETASMLGGRNLLLSGVGGMYLLGKGSTKDTARMAMSALIVSGVATDGLKLISGRGRPNTEAEPGEFMGPGATGNRTSFPSGHTSAAFAVASVMAHRHPKHKWLYYGLASTVGMARVRKSAHYPSDVLVGAGIGMYAGHRAVSGDVSVFPFRFRF